MDPRDMPRSRVSGGSERLRLVREPRSTMRERVNAVGTENRAAAVTMHDARWAFAARVAANLDGGPAAALSPERRERLIAGAARVGLRPFDANLIIAIVQDNARHTGMPLSPDVASRLGHIAPPTPPRADPEWLLPLVASACLAVALAWTALAWLNG